VLLRAKDEPIEADLLVVGSRGQGVHAGLLLGSTSLQLAERATIPFVIVPSGRD
jgi:nucleotide-binding universal stress UspA family protein